MHTSTCLRARIKQRTARTCFWSIISTSTSTATPSALRVRRRLCAGSIVSPPFCACERLQLHVVDGASLERRHACSGLAFRTTATDEEGKVHCSALAGVSPTQGERVCSSSLRITSAHPKSGLGGETCGGVSDVAPGLALLLITLLLPEGPDAGCSSCLRTSRSQEHGKALLRISNAQRTRAAERGHNDSMSDGAALLERPKLFLAQLQRFWGIALLAHGALVILMYFSLRSYATGQ
ncbi:hypothetical protein NA57DRAFT_62288 [Rhizodiscina lignyota]|uniref:Transmembrane protein n=1 Tax=Rhizodiscina lignyota TaxID=1504668 RepID=A0A9P4M0R1_9PEZI|nr:hypothetical protein NA57DRAFT_62288 [Rhizodiscina lignyota]